MGKAAGLDNIPPEALKEVGEVIVDVLHKFLNKIWRKGEIQNCYKASDQAGKERRFKPM